MRRAHVLAAAIALFALSLPAAARAHEIPHSVAVHAFVKPEGGRLRVIVRAPLSAMRDIQFPETADGLLDVQHAEPFLQDAIARWILPGLEIYEDGRPLSRPAVAALRVSLPSDRSFSSYEGAFAHVTAAPMSGEAQLPWQQALLDVLLEYPIASDRSAFSIRPGFERLAVDVLTVLRFVSPDGVRGFEFHGDAGVVRLDPRWHQAAWLFVKIGFVHILDGTDHLLFLLCLVIPLRRIRPLILVVTAFTIAHSISLAAAAYDLAPDALWFPPLVEMLIAGSIFYVALENIFARASPSRRWLVAFGFGLVHGFGFSFALKETLQFAGSHLLTSLLSFNAGVEIGQVLVLLVLVPALQLLFRFVVRERIGTIALSAIIAHVAWHWMADRWSALRQFPAPSVDAPGLLAVRVLLVVAAVLSIAWLVKLVLTQLSVRRRLQTSTGSASTDITEPDRQPRWRV